MNKKFSNKNKINNNSKNKMNNKLTQILLKLIKNKYNRNQKSKQLTWYHLIRNLTQKAKQV